MRESTDAKMIEVKVKFWTNDIARQKSKVIAKHAWQSGNQSDEAHIRVL
jgi:hypothetical protein